MRRNTALFDKVADAIESSPEQWRQQSWVGQDVCRTTFCIGGWAIHESGMSLKLDDEGLTRIDGTPANVDEIATQLLGITDQESTYLFYGGYGLGVSDAPKVAQALRDIGRGANIAEKLFPLGWY